MSGSELDAKATLSALLPTPSDLERQSSQQEANAVLTETEKNFELQRREQIIREKDLELERLNFELTTLHHEGIARWWVLVILGVYVIAWSAATWITLWVMTFSDAVLITLFSTTLGQVLGLTAIALRWLFPKRKRR